MEVIAAFFSDTLNCLYGILLGLGFGYSLLLLVGAGSDLFGGADADLGLDADVSLDVDADIGAEADAADVVKVSTLAIASGISAAGAFGIVSRALFDASAGVSIVVALVGGVAVGALAQAALVYVLSHTSRTAYSAGDLVGRTAEVITAIPANSLGQIALVAGGSRVTFGARAADGSPVPRGTTVTIEKVVGGVAYVLPEPHAWI